MEDNNMDAAPTADPPAPPARVATSVEDRGRQLANAVPAAEEARQRRERWQQEEMNPRLEKRYPGKRQPKCED